MLKSLTLTVLTGALLTAACASLETAPTGALKPGTDWVVNSPDWAAEAEAVKSSGETRQSLAQYRWRADAQAPPDEVMNDASTPGMSKMLLERALSR